MFFKIDVIHNFTQVFSREYCKIFKNSFFTVCFHAVEKYGKVGSIDKQNDYETAIKQKNR